jgi:hypothetical protein
VSLTVDIESKSCTWAYLTVRGSFNRSLTYHTSVHVPSMVCLRYNTGPGENSRQQPYNNQNPWESSLHGYCVNRVLPHTPYSQWLTAWRSLVSVQGCVVLFGGELSSPDDFALTNETWVYRTDTQTIETLHAQGQYTVWPHACAVVTLEHVSRLCVVCSSCWLSALRKCRVTHAREFVLNSRRYPVPESAAQRGRLRALHVRLWRE